MYQSNLTFFIFAGIELAIIVWVIARRFNGAAGRTLKEKTNAEGQKYFFSQRRYGKYGGRSVVSAGVAVRNGFVFSIWRRNFWHRFLTPLGLAQDIRTGDPLLDDTFYFMTDDDEKLKTLLVSPGFVPALREAFEALKTRNVECRQNKIWFNTGPINDSQINEGYCEALAVRLAAEVEKLEAPSYASPFASFPLSRLSFLYRIIHVSFLVLGGIAAATLLTRSEEIINKKDFFVEAASISPVILILWLSLLMVIFGKSSWFPQVCGSFVLSGVAGLALLTGFTLREVNIDLDRSRPEIKNLWLEAKSCTLHCSTGGKHARTADYPLGEHQCSLANAQDTIMNYRQQDYRCYHSAHINYALFFPWPTERPEGDTEKYTLPVNAESFEHAYTGEDFSFPIHSGTLNLPWIRKADVRGE